MNIMWCIETARCYRHFLILQNLVFDSSYSFLVQNVSKYQK